MALLDTEPFLELRKIDWSKAKPEDLEKLRQISFSPEFRRWREIVKETIEVGEVPPRIDSSTRSYLDVGAQAHQIRLLVALSRLDGAEADPKALYDALKLNRAFASSDSLFVARVTAGNDSVIHERLAESLGQQSPEALRDFASSLHENSAMHSGNVLASLQSDRKHTLDWILEDPEGLLQLFGERPENSELLQFFRDPIQMQDLQKMFKRLEDRFCETWQQSPDWSQRLQAVQAFQNALNQGLDGRVSEAATLHFVELLGMSADSVDTVNRIAGAEAKRQSLAAALVVEQFRREQGRLPVSLEEAGWAAPTEITGLNMNMHYETREGKAFLSTNKSSESKLERLEVKW
ncbi:MAG: hypothetical protein RL095_3440 [Verrucomicrobiota bacterium]